ncbi:MAG: S-layer homology domain-containing protein [Clostridia bacterium]|nr:S-layer homology domain-containing protein [Clostridia bacterium]
MKEILSAITAVLIAASAMLPAITVNAAEKITADQVKELIYSTGLKAYPELWDKTITTGAEEDVLKPETRTVKDVIDVNKSYQKFFITNSSGKYLINYDDVVTLKFRGLNDSGKHVDINANTENFILDELSDMVHYVAEGDNVEFITGLEKDYNRIAEIINESDISDVKDIKYVSYGKTIFFSALYVTDSHNHEYVIPISGYTDNHAEVLGKEVKSIEEERVMDFTTWCSYIDEFNENFENDKSNRPKYEEIKGDEIRDTDTRAAYIGTESKFVDVSDDLVSYVNELNDLGIINGYDGNMFMPDNTITRAEAAAMLARMMKYTGSYNGKFTDVNADDWFAEDVATLTEAGVINGYDENTFAPHDNIKYQEVMKILVFTLGYTTKYDTVFDNFYPSMTNQKAMEIGLTDGLNSFDTTAAITRGDMAIMLSNALDTHMFTEVKLVSPEGKGGGGVSQPDITLIDYLNGRKLNGTIPKAYFD